MATMSKAKNLSAGVAPQNKKKAGPVDAKGAYTKVQERTIGKMKMGGMMKKAKAGGEFGMLSVKAGVDNNPNPTAADRIAGATKGKAKSGAKMKKAMMGSSMMQSPMMKKGGKMMKKK
jgi:hypothetical protein